MPRFRVEKSPYWYGYVYDRDGNRTPVRSLRVKDSKAADGVLAEWERELADPAHAASKGITLSKAVAGLIGHYRKLRDQGKKSAATVGYYEEKTGVILDVVGQHGPLSFITAQLVDRFISVRRDEKASEHTIAKELGAWKVLLRYAKRQGWWSGDLEAIFPRFATEYDPRDRSLTEDELYALLAIAPSDDTAAQIAFAVATSAELGCIQRAQRRDVSEDGRYVLIRGTKRESRWRTVPIVTAMQKRLVAFALKHARGRAPYLFRSIHGMRNELRRRCKELDLPHTSTNDLRRTFAVYMREDGFPLELIAPLMGHKDTRMLERVYGRLSAEQLRERLILALNASAAWQRGGKERGGSARIHADENPASP